MTVEHDVTDETATLAADAVIFARDVRDGSLRVLLIERAHDPHAGAWALPGGKLNPAEGDRDAAAREASEETGITVAPGEFTEVGTYRAPGRDPRGRTVSFAWAVVLDQQPAARAGDDATSAAWHPVDALPAMAFDHERVLADALRAVAAVAAGATDLAADSDQVRALYHERAHLLAVLAGRYLARLAFNDPREPGLPVLYLHTPAGQISYHLNPEHRDLFDHVPTEIDSLLCTWDGHTKADALGRLRELASIEHTARQSGLDRDTLEHVREQILGAVDDGAYTDLPGPEAARAIVTTLGLLTDRAT